MVSVFTVPPKIVVFLCGFPENQERGIPTLAYVWEGWPFLAEVGALLIRFPRKLLTFSGV